MSGVPKVDAAVDEGMRLLGLDEPLPPIIETALQDLVAERDALRAAVTRTRAYVDDPGNWSTLDGRRRTILDLLAGNPA